MVPDTFAKLISRKISQVRVQLIFCTVTFHTTPTLYELNFGNFRRSKSTTLTIFEVLNFENVKNSQKLKNS